MIVSTLICEVHLFVHCIDWLSYHDLIKVPIKSNYDQRYLFKKIQGFI